MTKLVLLGALVLFGMLTLACSGRDQDGQMRDTALEFLYAWNAADFTTMSSLMDPEVVSNPCVFLRQDCLGLDESTDWNADEICAENFSSASDYLVPCYEREITNITNGPPDCREATPAEATKGYGRRCAFEFLFATRNKGSSQDFGDWLHCVIVQQLQSGLVVRQSYDTILPRFDGGTRCPS